VGVNATNVLCEGCDFLKWGVWAADLKFSNTGGNTALPTDLTAFGWWVAGDVVDVDTLAALGGGATYAGTAIGSVASDLDGNGTWNPYVSTGDLVMHWSFAQRAGDLTISKFDTQHFGTNGLTFTGNMCAPGVTSCGTPAGNHFGGELSGQLQASGLIANLPDQARNLSGFALGSFVRPLDATDGIPKGVIGNWGVGNDRYIASGIFAGARQ
jgi:hypothetical protein